MGSRAVQQGRRDATHQPIAEHLRANGWTVLDIAAAKNGADLAVSKDRFAALIECKDGSKPPSARELTDSEQKLKDSWQGAYIVALGPEDALEKLTVEMYLSGRGI